MVMSALGSPESPVRRQYSLRLLWLGAFLLYAALRFYRADVPGAPVLSALRLLCLGVFAVGAGLVTGLFSVGSSKHEKTVPTNIHGIGAAIGFTALLFHSLLEALGAFAQGRPLLGGVDLAAFPVGAPLLHLLYPGGQARPAGYAGPVAAAGPCLHVCALGLPGRWGATGGPVSCQLPGGGQ